MKHCRRNAGGSQRRYQYLPCLLLLLSFLLNSHAQQTTQPNVTTLFPNSSQAPSISPSLTTAPSLAPTRSPHPTITESPSTSVSPTETTKPSPSPSMLPSAIPSASLQPTAVPSVSLLPTVSPSESPSSFPTTYPSQYPSQHPSNLPSQAPSITMISAKIYNVSLIIDGLPLLNATDIDTWENLTSAEVMDYWNEYFGEQILITLVKTFFTSQNSSEPGTQVLPNPSSGPSTEFIYNQIIHYGIISGTIPETTLVLAPFLTDSQRYANSLEILQAYNPDYIIFVRSIQLVGAPTVAPSFSPAPPAVGPNPVIIAAIVIVAILTGLGLAGCYFHFERRPRGEAKYRPKDDEGYFPNHGYSVEHEPDISASYPVQNKPLVAYPSPDESDVSASNQIHREPPVVYQMYEHPSQRHASYRIQKSSEGNDDQYFEPRSTPYNSVAVNSYLQGVSEESDSSVAQPTSIRERAQSSDTMTDARSASVRERAQSSDSMIDTRPPDIRLRAKRNEPMTDARRPITRLRSQSTDAIQDARAASALQRAQSSDILQDDQILDELVADEVNSENGPLQSQVSNITDTDPSPRQPVNTSHSFGEFDRSNSRTSDWSASAPTSRNSSIPAGTPEHAPPEEQSDDDSPHLMDHTQASDENPYTPSHTGFSMQILDIDDLEGEM